MTTAIEPTYLSGADVARLLGITRSAVSQAAAAGTLRVAISRKHGPLFVQEDVEAYRRWHLRRNGRRGNGAPYYCVAIPVEPRATYDWTDAGALILARLAYPSAVRAWFEDRGASVIAVVP